MGVVLFLTVTEAESRKGKEISCYLLAKFKFTSDTGSFYMLVCRQNLEQPWPNKKLESLERQCIEGESLRADAI